MLTRSQFYSGKHSRITSKYNDYGEYVLDCYDNILEYMGADALLANLVLALDIDTLGDNLEYIARTGDLDDVVGQ